MPASVASRAGVWGLSEKSSLLLRNWGDEYLAYSELTGQTHLLEPFVGMVLHCLQAGACTSSELAARVAEALQLEQDDQLLTTIEQTLADFERLGLIEQNPV